jgi:hypothetical protein
MRAWHLRRRTSKLVEDGYRCTHFGAPEILLTTPLHPAHLLIVRKCQRKHMVDRLNPQPV